MKKRIKRWFLYLLAVLLIAVPVIPVSASIASPDTLEISSVDVYRHCLELNDQLYLITGTIDYTVNPTEGDAGDLFLIRIMNGSTELGVTTPYPYYDDGYDYFCVGIYFSASEVSADSIGWGSGTGYSARLEGNPLLDWTAGDPPLATYSSFDSWNDNTTVEQTRAIIPSRLRTIALIAETEYSTTLTEVVNSYRRYTTAGEDYFTQSIPNLRTIAPSMFGYSVIAPDFPDSDLVTDGNTGGDNATKSIYGVTYGAQTFTPSLSYDISGVYLKIYKVGSPADLTISVRATASNLPTGSDVVTGIVDADDVTTDTRGDWTQGVFTSTSSLTQDTVYSVVFSCATGDASNYYGVRMGSDLYSGGRACVSSDSGSAWSADGSQDYMFTITSDGDHNLSWLQVLEGGLIGTMFDFTDVASDFNMPTLLFSTIIWFILSALITFGAIRKANDYKVGLPVLGFCMIIGGIVGFVYPILMIGAVLLVGFGALYVVFFGKSSA